MRRVAVVLLLVYPALVYAESDTAIDLDKYLSETKRIMKVLNIDIREVINKDGALNVVADDHVKMLVGYFKSNYVVPEKDTSRRSVSYKSPMIYISPLCDSILQNKKQVSGYVRLQAETTLIHELTHYLQTTPREKNYKGDLDKLDEYINQPTEFEAMSVMGYYYLEKTKDELFDVIIKSDDSGKRKMAQLISTYLWVTRGIAVSPLIE